MRIFIIYSYSLFQLVFIVYVSRKKSPLMTQHRAQSICILPSCPVFSRFFTVVAIATVCHPIIIVNHFNLPHRILHRTVHYTHTIYPLLLQLIFNTEIPFRHIFPYYVCVVDDIEAHFVCAIWL